MVNKRSLERGIAGLLVVALVLSMVSAVGAPAAVAQTSELIITGVIDGPLTDGLPKAVEFYAVNEIADLSVYGFGSANNGGGTDGEEYTFPSGSAAAGDFIYVATEEAGFATFFGFAPTYTSLAASINGDDAIELFQNGVVVDVFGNINVDGTGQPWEYMDGWAYRVAGTGPDGDTFVLTNWTFSGPNALDGETSNATAADPFPIATYSPTAEDADGDGVPDNIDNCPDTYNPGQEDSDGDGIGDDCDGCPNDPENDADGDNLCGDVDNCPYTYNPGQEDSDGDGIGDVCEAGQPLPLEENFDDCTLAGWEIVSVDADTTHTWSCNATYKNIDVNGYGDSAPADEWLITPPLNLDAQGNDTLTFRSWTNYTDINYPQVSVLYSTDYDGGGDPMDATWTALSGITFSPEDSELWTDSGEVDLSGISGTNVYIAFRYVSSGTGSGTAANWRLDTINVFEAISPGQPLPLVEDFDDCTLAGWEIVSVDADTAHTWSCSATYKNIDVNGYGDSAPADEWLITPPLNLDAQGNDTLTFRSWTNYTDINYPQVSVLYSTDYDGGGDPMGATWTALSGITFSPEDSELWTDSGEVDLSGISGTNVYIAFRYVSSGTGSGTAANWRLDAINISEQILVGDWVLNEIHADPDSTLGDANGDLVAQYSDDEFVEIYNNSGADVDIGDWTLSDAVGVRHTFPAGTVVPAGCAIVVFGGGTPTGTFGGSVVQTASTGALGLNNGGDSVTLFDGSGDVAAYSYGGEGGDNQSLTRDPDITGPEPLVKHTTATGSGGSLFSPGTMVDGTKFAGCVLVNLIHDIQGSGAASPLAGSAVTIEGIVVGDFQNNAEDDNGDLRGFYVQEEDADADADLLTSEGVFVYDGYSPGTDVMVGDFVRVKGQVAEYNGITEITGLTEVTVLSSGNDLPTPAAVYLPLSALTDMEAYEGMSVTFPQALYISEYYNFDRYGEIVLTSARQEQPTAIYDPGSPEAADLAAANLLDRITLDDGRTSSNPDPAIHPNGDIFDLDNLFRGGDTVTDVTGVVDYYNGYKIQPTMGADYVSANPRTAQPDVVGGDLKVASFNVLNYFTTLDGTFPGDDDGPDICGPLSNQDCRGANDEAEFTRQRDKIIAALSAMDADVVGLIEIENHPGDVPTADLVAGLNAVMGAGAYDYIATGAIGSDAIRQALIYKPATVTPQGAFAILDSSVDPRFLDDYNRPVLAQTFMDNTTGGIFTVAVNHLKSKGSDCDDIGDPDTGDGSGNCNLTRKAAAEALVDWLATDPTSSGDEDFLIIGDLNSYDKEDPIDAIKAGPDDTLGTEDDYTDLILAYQGEHAYSYVFDSQIGYLDHALANVGLLSEVTGTTVWHINADEPDLIDYDMTYKEDAQDAIYAPDAYRSSDHDPVIVGLNVCDEIAPTFDEVTVSPDMLWPPNHKYVDVTATVVVSDNFDPNPTVTLVSVTSDEPDSGLDDEDVPIDIVIVDDFHFQLRAERWDEGDGRTYTITYQVTDACGNSTLASVTVTVPHDKR